MQLRPAEASSAALAATVPLRAALPPEAEAVEPLLPPPRQEEEVPRLDGVPLPQAGAVLKSWAPNVMTMSALCVWSFALSPYSPHASTLCASSAIRELSKLA